MANEYNPLPFFHDKVTGKESENLLDLIRDLDLPRELMLDVNCPSGLAEIDLRHHDFGHRYVIDEKAILSEKVNGMIIAIKDYFRREHDGSKHYLFSMSGGFDSRTIALILKQLQEESGLYQDLTILTHEPEIEIVEEFLRLHPLQCLFLPWKKDTQSKPNYYEFDKRTNGFCGPQIKYWDLDESKYTMITGLLGGEQFEYPCPHATKITNQMRQQNTIGSLWFWMKNPAAQMCRDAILWKDMLFPYLSWNFLKISMTLPKSFYQMETFEEGDKVRLEFMKQLGNKGPIYRGHKYNFSMTPAYQQSFTIEMQKSTLVQHFKEHNGNVTNAQPSNTITDKFHLYSKLYGLALTYERIFQ
jgi:hypothetical protein